jgi:hypothetical protein
MIRNVKSAFFHATLPCAHPAKRANNAAPRTNVSFGRFYSSGFCSGFDVDPQKALKVGRILPRRCARRCNSATGMRTSVSRERGEQRF